MTPFFTERSLLSSEKPDREIWDLLSLNLISEHLNSATGYTYNKAKLNTMRTLYRQSRELFNASENTSLETSPLLDYYSYYMLSKILIIKSQRIGIEAIGEKHGLSFHLDREKPICSESIAISINSKGTFNKLLNSFNRQKSVKEYCSTKINLKELLLHDIDIYDYVPFEAKMLPVYDFRIRHMRNLPNATHDNRVEIRFIGKPTPETFEITKRKVPDLDLSMFHLVDGILADLPGYPIILDYNMDDILPDFDIERNVHGEIFLIPPLQIGNKSLLFYQIEILFMISFAIANLVRYYPLQWVELLSDEKRLWNIRKAIAHARRSFPNHILNYMAEEFHNVLPPGSLKRL